MSNRLETFVGEPRSSDEAPTIGVVAKVGHVDASDPLGLVGQLLDGKYEVQQVAGIGGTAVVYRAQHRALERPVAIKVVRILSGISTSNGDALFTQLSQEATLLASLSERTSAILQARDIGMVEIRGGFRVPYLVLEWLDGASLEEVLERERAAGLAPRSLEEAMYLLEPVAQALAIAHRHGIAHRDVKPANVFVVGDARTPSAIVKVLDFGIAKVVSAAQAMDGGFRTTSANTFSSFTPAYGAPEQFSRSFGATGPWTDVFALALVLAEVATGRQALSGDDLAQLAAASTSKETRPSLRALGLVVADGVEAVFARAVAVDPTVRYGSVLELWRDLALAVGQAPRSRGWPSSPDLPALATSPESGPVAAPPPPISIRRLHGATTEPAALESQTRLRKPRGWARTAASIASVTAIGALLGAAAFAYPRLHATRPRAAAPVASSAVAAAVIPSDARAASCPEGMLPIPGGRFFMGSDDAIALDFERPAHQVTLSPYCIDRTEVTVAAYKSCSDTGDCKRAPTTNEWTEISAHDRAVYDPLCTAGDPVAHATHPVNCIDWTLADAFCRAQSKRLPTEAEWEFAARGPDGRVYPWGDELPSGDLLNACGAECVRWARKAGAPLEPMYGGDDGFPTIAPVGSFPRGASRYGVEDVVGNVWEWVADWYGPYASRPETEPLGPMTGTERVIRGGGWNGSNPAWVRPTFRYKDRPGKRSHGIGFRCAAEQR